MVGITSDGVWLDRAAYGKAEVAYHEQMCSKQINAASTVASEIAKAREQIAKSLKGDFSSGDMVTDGKMGEKMLHDMCEELMKISNTLQARVMSLETRLESLTMKFESCGLQNGEQVSKPAETKASNSKEEEDDDDDLDLFGSDDEEEAAEAKRVREERLAEYAAKKAKKPAVIAKSSVILDIKPWDDETDLKVLEKHVREISMDGLHWGTSKFAPMAFGIQKLVMVLTVEDEKVSVDDLTEKIEQLDNFVQSVDVAAFNKI